MAGRGGRGPHCVRVLLYTVFVALEVFQLIIRFLLSLLFHSLRICDDARKGERREGGGKGGGGRGPHCVRVLLYTGFVALEVFQLFIRFLLSFFFPVLFDFSSFYFLLLYWSA